MTLDHHPRSLPRLDASCYRADAAVLWTLTTVNRATGSLNDNIHFQWREILLHACARCDLLCPVYTLMPDHIHLAWIGIRPDSDQRNAMAFLRTHFEPLIAPTRFNHQPHDHALSRKERTRNAFLKVCEYIMLNPVRAGLAKETSSWPYTGCMFAGYAGVTPFTDNYWPWFWKIFYKLRDRDCDSHIVVRKVNGGADSAKSQEPPDS